MVNINMTTCLTVTHNGTVFAGTEGGGIARWDPSGNFASVQTIVENLPSNHIVDISTGRGVSYAITSLPDPFFLATGSGGIGWWNPGQIQGASGPLKMLRGGEDLLVLDAGGAVFISYDETGWVQPNLPSGVAADGWTLADLDGEVMALSNGTDVVLVDLANGNFTQISTPSVNDLDLVDGHLAIAADSHPDVYSIATGEWLGPNVTSTMSEVATGWVQVRNVDGRFHAASLEGVVISAEVNISDPGEVQIQGSIEEGEEVHVKDMEVLVDGNVLLATDKGIWLVANGGAAPYSSTSLSMPPSNDIYSVRWEADAQWTLTSVGISSVVFDSQGFPVEWLEGPTFAVAPTKDRLETAFKGGVVYMVGFGPTIHTYDTFASSALSRWGTIDTFEGQGAKVLDIGVAGDGALYVATEDGIQAMTNTEPPAFAPVPGAPDKVLCMEVYESGIEVGTEVGLYTYHFHNSSWTTPEDIWGRLPPGAYYDIAQSPTSTFYAMQGTLYYGASSKVLSTVHNISDLAGPVAMAGPVMAVVNGTLMAYDPTEDREVRYPEEERLSRVDIRAVDIGPGGMVYIATDSGLQRLGPFNTNWFSWTTTDGLSANDIRDLAVEPGSDDLWIAAYGGVDVMNTNTHETIRVGTEDGLPSNLVYDVMFRQDTEVWVGTDVGGAARKTLPSGEWQAFNMSTGLVADDVQAVAYLDEYILFGTDEGVTVLNLDDSTFSTHTASSTGFELPGDWVWCAIADAGEFIVGTNRGLGIYDIGLNHWVSTHVEGIEGEEIRSLAYGSEDSIWVGTGNGLVILNVPERGVVHVGIDDGLPGEEVLSIMKGSEGWMWVGTSAGVAVLDQNGSILATFSTRDGLVHDRVEAIAEHPDGRIWFGTAGGLSMLMKNRWDLLPQWSHVTIDIPDVSISLPDVRISPEYPTEDDPVTINVTVSNPSGLRAIVTIGLYEDDSGVPGEEVDRVIAYTEPGETYDVTLGWFAKGGDWTLWIVADPDNVVPETNEQNNLVAVNLHVNSPPVLLDPTYEIGEPWGLYPNHRVNITIDVTYVDADGDFPSEIWAGVIGSHGVEEPFDLVPIAGSGDHRTGITYTGEMPVKYGNSSIWFYTGDGRSYYGESMFVALNMNFTVDGIQTGDVLDGEVTFDVQAVEPWEGNEWWVVVILLTEPGTLARGDDIRLLFEGTGPTIVTDASGIPEGEYDIWVLTEDDRGLQGITIIPGVVVEHDDDSSQIPIGWPLISAIVLAAIVIVVVFFLFRKGGDDN
jgi:ligand-binding sensor domain-containing protein